MLLELAVLNVVIMLALAALPARQARRPREHRREARNALRETNAHRRAGGVTASGRVRGGSDGFGFHWPLLRHPAALVAASAVAVLAAGGAFLSGGSPDGPPAGPAATAPTAGGELWCTFPASESPTPLPAPSVDLPPIVVPVVAAESAPRAGRLRALYLEV